MKLIQFLKPDLRRVSSLLIILSPLIFLAILILIDFFVPEIENSDLFHQIFNSLYPIIGPFVGVVLMPAIFAYLVFFGGFNPGGGGLISSSCPFSLIGSFLFGGMFWYAVSCAISPMRKSLIELESIEKESKRNEKKAKIYLIILFSALATLGHLTGSCFGF